MRFLARRWLGILVLVGMVLGPALSACSFSTEQSKTENASVTVSPDVSRPEAVSAEGVITPFKKVDLSFESSGRVQTILVSEGDYVVAGQQLAVLETSDLEQAMLQAQAHLESAQAQLAKARAGARPEEVAEAEAGVAVAQAASTAASGALTIAESQLAEAEAKQRAARDGIGVARSQLASTKAGYQAALAAYNKLKAQPTAHDVQVAEKQVEIARNQVWNTQLMYEAEQANAGEAEVGDIQVKIAEINLDKVKAGARSEDIAEAKGVLDQTAANIKVAEARVAKAQALATQAQAGLLAAQSGLAQAKAHAAKAASQALEAQAQLDLARAGSRVEDIAAAEAAVKQAEASLGDAKNDLEDALLKAPFDGTVGAILIHEGDLVAPQVVAMRFGDLSRLQVETKDLSEVDISRVEVGQRATIIVDALEGKELSATVASVSPMADKLRGEVVYKVTLDLEAGSDVGLRWGMSTLTEIKAGPYRSSASNDAAQGVSGEDVVSAQAVIVPDRTADLSFKMSGAVHEILVSESERVTAGQPLIKQETRHLEQIVLEAEAGLGQAQANLAKAQAGARPQETAASQAAVDVAEANARAAEAAAAVAEAKVAVAQAEVDVARADGNMANAQIAVLQGALSAAQARLDKAITGPTAFDIEIAERQVEVAQAGLRVIELLRPAARRYGLGVLATYQSQVELALLQLQITKAGTGAEDLAAAHSAVAQAESDVQAARGQSSQSQAQVLVAQAGLETARAQAAEANAEAEVARAQVQVARARLSTLQAGSRQEDVAAATAGVTAATAALATARNALEDATLKAPFDGVVGAVRVNVGELVQPAEVVITLGDLGLFVAETEDLSEVDISRIQVGQRAAVTVDALDGQVLPGTVYSVAPVATELRGDAVYKIGVALNDAANGSLRWGMSAFVEIDTATRAGASSGVVPAQAMPVTAAQQDTE